MGPFGKETDETDGKTENAHTGWGARVAYAQAYVVCAIRASVPSVCHISGFIGIRTLCCVPQTYQCTFRVPYVPAYLPCAICRVHMQSSIGIRTLCCVPYVPACLVCRMCQRTLCASAEGIKKRSATWQVQVEDSPKKDTCCHVSPQKVAIKKKRDHQPSSAPATTWHDMVRHGTTWHGTARHGTTQHDTARQASALL